MGKNVAVFVDVANIFYAAKAAGVDIDYVTLLKSATAGRDFVRAYAYTGLDPDNENQRNFHAFLARNHYKVVSKDIRKYGDGKVKANLDIELVVDMMKTARNLDIAIVVSGDGDFAPAIRAVQEMGVRVEVISFRGNTSSDLIDVADLFTDITQLARVDKSSSRSGRRVAGDDEDLSMTEVPDKQTEGTGSRTRGRGRGRGRSGDEVAASSRGSRGTAAAPVAASANGGGSLVALPGEKLSRAASAGPSETAAEVDEDELQPIEEGEFAAALEGEVNGDGRRRRRRRGGRGRGRGRGREEGVGGEAPVDGDALVEDEAEELLPEQPRGPRTTPFGSFWDTQLGAPTAPARGPIEPLGDDEDFEEPEIPEYLIAEQRRGRQQSGNRGGGGGSRGRGARSAYNAAIERERYGRGGGGGGINRYPDVSGRDRQGGGGGGGGQRGGRDQGYVRQDRPERIERAPRPSGGDPWSEVPPELEEMLRAQLAQTSKGRPAPTPARSAEPSSTEAASGAAEAPAAPRRRTTRKPADAGTPAEAASVAPVADSEAAAAPKRRTTRKPAATSTATDGAAAEATASETTAPKRRTTRKAAGGTTADANGATAGAEPEAAAPKRRTIRKKAEPA